MTWYYQLFLLELKDKLGDLQLEKEKEKEKESRAPLNHSYDSALGTDFSDGDTETVEIELDWSNCLMDFGFSLAGGKCRPVYNNDYGLYVVSIARGGPADGKLKINDCLLKVGTLSCTAADSDSVLNLLRSTKMPVSLTVKRRRCLYQGLYSVKLPLGCGVSHGLTLENGIYIRSVTPGSIAARESTLKAGDRLCSINGRILDSMTSFIEVISFLFSLSHFQI
jgi:C-terminal processing protease CtpA/Prc